MRKYYFQNIYRYFGTILFVLIEGVILLLKLNLLFSLNNLLFIVVFLPFAIMIIGLNFSVHEKFICGRIFKMKIRKIEISKIVSIYTSNKKWFDYNLVIIISSDGSKNLFIPYFRDNIKFLEAVSKLNSDIEFKKKAL